MSLSQSGLGCGHIDAVERVWRMLCNSSLSLSVEQPVSQHHDPRLGKVKIEHK